MSCMINIAYSSLETFPQSVWKYKLFLSTRRKAWTHLFGRGLPSIRILIPWRLSYLHLMILTSCIKSTWIIKHILSFRRTKQFTSPSKNSHRELLPCLITAFSTCTSAVTSKADSHAFLTRVKTTLTNRCSIYVSKTNSDILSISSLNSQECRRKNKVTTISLSGSFHQPSSKITLNKRLH